MDGRCRVVLLSVILSFTPVGLHAKGNTKSEGIIPATPPVNVHTQAVSRRYVGLGYLNFSVKLPISATPGFTLGPDEDATFKVGEAKFDANGLALVGDGLLDREMSHERAWIGGALNASMTNDTFTREGVLFNIDYERSGFFFSRRSAYAWRIGGGGERFVLDIGFSHMWSLYNFSGNSRLESETISGESWKYISDFDETTTGFAYRPVLTLQPLIRLGNRVSLIPFVGASAFASLSYSYWEVNEWEDVLYGPDCFDGCPDSQFDADMIPIETIAGFDVEWQVTKKGRLSLSSFFSADAVQADSAVSEVYVIYTVELQ